MRVAQQLEPVSLPKTPPPRSPQGGLVLLAMALLGALTFDKIVEWVDGEPQLKKSRQKQMERELKEMEDAEQYVLVAELSQNYPCLKCPFPVVFLNVGEVWKYGVTRKGESGRYTSTFYVENGLRYIPEYRGTLQECLEQEKIKIFHYPLLPENIARPKNARLALPPGNLRTD